MKKILTFTMTAALSICLCACSGSAPGASSGAGEGEINPDEIISAITDVIENVEQEVQSGSAAETAVTELSADEMKDSFDKGCAYVDALLDDPDLTADKDEENSEFLYCAWYTDNELEQPEFPMDVVIDGSTVTIGKATYKDLEDLDFEIELGQETLEPDESVSITLVKDGKRTMLNTVFNRSEGPMSLNDAPIGNFSSMFNEFCIPFTYAGLDGTATPEDFLKMFGLPNSSVNLSSDAYGTTINFSYFNDSTEGDASATRRLEPAFTYDPETDTAVLSGISLYYDPY